MPSRYPDMQQNLEILGEETSEVTLELIALLARINRMKSKIIRFGLQDFHPCNEQPNQQALGVEIGHMMAMVDCLVEHGVVLRSDIAAGKQDKLNRLQHWYRGTTDAL